jgi:SAM-dependent methyltransferase
VDSFAAARQQSFDMATGDYCFWCDSDDVLESGAEVVRQLAERGGYPCFVFPYKILGQGLVLPRDRMVLKDAGKWVYAVHEAFQFAISPTQAVRDDRVVITHLPHLSKSGSNERNLRILRSIPEQEMHTGMYYHLHLESALAGKIPESIEAAKKALARPDIGKPEKYEIFLNLHQVSEDPAIKESFLVQAYAADPCRREALGLLAVNALNTNRNEEGLAYARQMISTTRPKEAWNDRAAAYDWVGDDVFAQALRANNKFQDAEMVRLNALKRAGGPRIALIHATRGRYEQAAITRKLWLDLAAKPDQIEHIFVMDADDEDSAPLRRLHHLVVPKGGGCVAAWNIGATATVAPVLMQLSDDWVPFPKWDEAILARLGNLDEPKVLAISDGHRTDQLLCMAICTRRYFNFDHFLFHPWFTGVYSDNWFSEQAYQRGMVTEAKDIIFDHQHPAFDSAKPVDRTYAEQNAPERYAQGQAVIEELRKGNDWSTVPGFFNYWSFYQFIAKNLQDGDTVCEVGCWLGRSLIYLAQECQRLGKKARFIAVDTFQGEAGQYEHESVVKANGGNFRAAFEANLKRCGVADLVQVIEGDSAESAAQVADGSLAFCFIDAAHDYESVKRDITAWRGKVKAGGVLAGHDADWHGVRKAVDELVEKPIVQGCIWIKEVK